jgi:hypothetical protein
VEIPMTAKAGGKIKAGGNEQVTGTMILILSIL